MPDGKAGQRRPFGRRVAVIGFVCALVIAGIVAAALASRRLLTENALVKALSEASDSAVQIGAFRRTALFNPGCVAENVVFRRREQVNGPPLMTIQRLTIRTGLTGMLTKHIDELRLEGVDLKIPPLQSHPKFVARGSLSIGQILIEKAVVTFGGAHAGRAPLRFEIHQAAFSSFDGVSPVRFGASLRIPEPPGEVEISGHIGPWKAHQPAQTPLEGTYSFQHAILGKLKGVAGVLSSQGNFSGILEHIQVEGSTDTPNFEAKQAGHLVHLETRFKAVVNGRNGDTFLEPVDAHFRKTTIVSKGAIAAPPSSPDPPGERRPEGKGPGKTASLDLSGQGRIEDVLWLISEVSPPKMTGALTFSTKVAVPPGPRDFLQKLNLQGDFGITGVSFTNPATQQEVATLSTRVIRESHGKPATKLKADQEPVQADLKGHVAVKDGIATLSSVAVSIPGVSGDLSGTFSLISTKVDLKGKLRLEAPPSAAATGVKSLLLRFLNPLFKKKGAFEVPVKITGTYANPSFGLALGSSK